LAAYEAIPARKLIKLTETYVKMDMETLATRVSEGSFTQVNVDEAEQLVVKLVGVTSRAPQMYISAHSFASLARLQVTQGSLFARITHPTEGPAYVEFTDDPEPYRSSGTVDRLGVQVVKLQQMGGVLARMEQQLSMHEAWLKEVSQRAAG
jgi:hypothetical protein